MAIREERVQDRPAVRRIHRHAFGGGHGEVVADLVDDLRHDDPAASSFVWEDDGEVVGHVLFSRCLLDAPRRLVEVACLSPLAVTPQWQRRGIGSALIGHGLRHLDAKGVPLVFLEGDPAYYSRAGFRRAAGLGFRRPSLRIPDAGFQVATLSRYEPWMTGTLVYPDTFWRHDCVGLRDTTA
jgi:putative acetyltransferase